MKELMELILTMLMLLLFLIIQKLNGDPKEELEDEEEEPLDLSWPESWVNRVFYLIKLPLLLMLSLLPDVRRPVSSNFKIYSQMLAIGQ